MNHERYCAICGIRFLSRFANAKFHSDECRRLGKLKLERERMAARVCREYVLADAALAEIRRAAAPRVARGPRLRYATLAATPDEPAANADRDAQLTGGAGAVSYAANVRLVGVGI